MTTRDVRVSVVLPVRNGQAYLPHALDSLARDPHDDLEIVVVDDASSDRTPDLLQRAGDPRLVVVRSDVPLGVAAALNRGMEVARGHFIARLDADDEWVPGRVTAQSRALDSDPQLAVVGGQFLAIDASGALTGERSRFPTSPDVIRWRLLFENVVAHPTVMLRRSAAMAVDGYRNGVVGAEDYDLWLRLWRTYAITNVPDVVVRYRRHESSESVTRLTEAERNGDAAAGALMAELLGKGLPDSVLRIVRERCPADDPTVGDADVIAAVETLYALRAAVARRMSPSGRRYVDRWLGRRLLRMMRAARRRGPGVVRELPAAARGVSTGGLALSLAAGAADFVTEAVRRRQR